MQVQNSIVVVFAAFAGRRRDKPCKGDNVTFSGLSGLARLGFGKRKGKLVAVAVGTLAGAMLGGTIERSLVWGERTAVERWTGKGHEVASANRKDTWRNPNSGNHGTVTPTRTYETAQGDVCREFWQTIAVGGKTETSFGRACREADGNWRIVR